MIDTGEILSAIAKKNEKVAKRIDEYNDKIKEFEDNTLGRSKQWIEDQTQIVKTKIDKLQKAINDWCKTQEDKMNKLVEEHAVAQLVRSQKKLDAQQLLMDTIFKPEEEESNENKEQ